MDESTSHIATSEAGASETQSEMRERQASEGVLMSSPSTVQGTGDEDDDEYDDEEESDEDEDKKRVRSTDGRDEGSEAKRGRARREGR